MYYVYNPHPLINDQEFDSLMAFCFDFLEIDTNPAFDMIVFDFDHVSNPPSTGYFDYDVDEKELQITIDKSLNKDEMIRTIFHEMVHLSQFLNGLYIPGHDDIGGSWNNIIYTCQYKDLPWEQDAYHKEDLMYRTYEVDFAPVFW